MPATAVLQFHFPTEFDARMPPHWDIRLRGLRDGEPPFTNLKVFDNPLSIREELRVEEETFEDAALFDASGRFEAGHALALPDRDAMIEKVEALDAEVLEDTEKILRLGFKGSKLQGVFVFNREFGQAFWEPGASPSREARALAPSGGHSHPHDFGGEHSHPGLPPASGAHDHAMENGWHAHREGDPAEGGHVNAGTGAHDHLLAKGLERYVLWAVDAHHPSHLWLPGHVKTWIKHVGFDADFREAAWSDWYQHVLWDTHSSGIANVPAHLLMFVNPDTRLIEKEYEFEDGTRRPATEADFQAERDWFAAATPPELGARLSEAAVGVDPTIWSLRGRAWQEEAGRWRSVAIGRESSGARPPKARWAAACPDGTVRLLGRNREEARARARRLAAETGSPVAVGHETVRGVFATQAIASAAWIAPARLSEFEVEGYDPEKVTDAQLADDWRLLAAKWATMRSGGETEFASEKALLDFSERVVGEILSRGTITFNPSQQQESTRELLSKTLERLVDRALLLPEPIGEGIAEGRFKMTVTSRGIDDPKEPALLVQGDRAFGFIRHEDEGERIGLEEFSARRGRHGVTEDARAAAWPESTRLFVYRIRDFVPLPGGPRKVALPVGAAGITNEFRFEEAAGPDPEAGAPPAMHLSSLPDKALVEMHGRLHAIWDAVADPSKREEVLNRHIDVMVEMLARGLEHRPQEDIDRRSLERTGHDKIMLDDALAAFQGPVMLKRPFLAIVGSTAVSGRGRDIDLWVNWPAEDRDFLRAIEFRVKSMLPRTWNVNFMADPRGPFTNFIEVADLKVEFRAPAMQTLQRMSEDLSDRARADGEASHASNEVKPTRFFFMPKPTAGIEGDEPRRFGTALDKLPEDPYPVLVQPKIDGMRIQAHKISDRVVLYSESGQAVGQQTLPTLIDELAAMSGVDSLVADAWLEISVDGERLSQPDVARYVMGGSFNPDKDMGASLVVHDVLYLNGVDLHNQPAEEAIRWLERIPSSDHVAKIRTDTAFDEETAKKAMGRLSPAPSEGALVKVGKETYPWVDENGKASPAWVEWRREEEIVLEVIGKIPVEGARSWSYVAAVPNEDGDLVPAGKTFNTRLDLDVGDRFRVSVGNVNRHVDPRTGREWFAMIFPRPLEKREGPPDTVETVRKLVGLTGGIDTEDEIPEDIARFLEQGGKRCMPAEKAKRASKADPRTLEIGEFRIFHHFRGESVHKDLRFKAGDDFLEGWTITDQPAGEVTEEPESVDEAYRAAKGVPWKFWPGMDPQTKVVAIEKERQPLRWFNVVNVVIPPGRPGASAEEEGVFTLCDEGKLHRGMEKPVFREFFFDGEVFKGRVVFRLISTKGFEDGEEGDAVGKRDLQWFVTTNLEDQTPTILGSRERRKPRDEQWVPPPGAKAIPPEWEEKIRPEFRWWDDGLSPDERLDRIDRAFNDLVERDEIAARKLDLGGEEETEAAEAVGPFDFASTQVDLSGEDREAVLDLTKTIEEADLYTEQNEDGETKFGREPDPHITVKYGIKDDSAASKVHGALRGYGKVRAKVSEVEVFKPKDEPYDVVVLRVESPDLVELNRRVAEATPCEDTHPTYKPHLTVAYVNRGSGSKYGPGSRWDREHAGAILGREFTFDEVTFSDRRGRTTPIPLTEGDYEKDEREAVRALLALRSRTIRSPEQADLPYRLVRFFWKGQTVVRGLPKFFFVAMIQDGDRVRWIRFEDNENPLEKVTSESGIAATVGTPEAPPPGERSKSAWLSWPEDGAIPADHPMNPNEEIDMRIEEIDAGKAEILNDTPTEIRVKFAGRELDRTLRVFRGSDDEDVWVAEPVEEPEPREASQ